ncbi:hypothetical protein [Brevibacillus brevis]|uniref:Group-specific protein n=1 Tax=Brevibacillus brevis TaxID=1393 RepID=A0ABY9T664_BREBE|nr:hypothetical protein [Brevibacillus brevis]WNC15580.1 hypothetical protein RGB73_04360 [Brevibacillus brevis]
MTIKKRVSFVASVLMIVLSLTSIVLQWIDHNGISFAILPPFLLLLSGIGFLVSCLSSRTKM